jgi:hypothetical protein
MKNIFVIALALILWVACEQPDPDKKVDTGAITNGVYYCPKIGWTIHIPNTWKIISKDSIEGLNQRGIDTINKSTKTNIEKGPIQSLISFRKDGLNFFISSIEPFKEDYTGEYEKRRKKGNEIICKAISYYNIKADTSSGKETVRGLEFERFTITRYNKEDMPDLSEIIYSKLLNGYDFQVIIYYKNDSTKQVMLDAFRNSTFDNKQQTY